MMPTEPTELLSVCLQFVALKPGWTERTVLPQRLALAVTLELLSDLASRSGAVEFGIGWLVSR